MAEPATGRASAAPRRRALVTGGSRGIGRAVVEYLAGSDVEVVALARDPEPLAALADTAARAGWTVHTTTGDAGDDARVADVVARYGPFDLVVANAGVASSAPLTRTTRADLDHHLAVNAGGVFSLLRATVPTMRERGWGRAVVVASTAGVTGAPYTSAYTASKHAAVGLVRAIASEVAGTGVTVNAVCPTFVDTDLTDASLARIADTTGRSIADARDALLATIPLGRFVTVEEVAAAVGYLCSGAAAPVNGQTLILDGGGIP